MWVGTLRIVQRKYSDVFVIDGIVIFMKLKKFASNNYKGSVFFNNLETWRHVRNGERNQSEHLCREVHIISLFKEGAFLPQV